MPTRESNLDRGIHRLCVSPSTALAEVIERHEHANDHGLPSGIALVLDDDGRLVGTLTDGDVRRALIRTGSLATPASEAMRSDPISFAEKLSYGEILRQLPTELERRGRRSRRFLGKIVLTDDAGRPTQVLDFHQLWEQRVASHRHVVVIGMGYVGLTLALELAEQGLQVTGVDSDPAKVAGLRQGRSHVHEQGLPELLREQIDSNFFVEAELPEGGDVFLIAVGTPVLENGGRHEPDLAALTAATRQVGKRLRRGGLVILRSTVPIGTTRGHVLPLLEQVSGLRGGSEFHLAFAPERTTEGNALVELRQLPQVIGGLGDDSVEATAALFRELTPTLVRVESLEAAELVKLINNSFRDLIFAFSNQVAQLGSQFDIDIVETIRAANHGYPRDPVPLPSPGVGGPCLTKDPYILASAAHGEAGQTLFAQARQVNESMHGFVAEAVIEQLQRLGKDPAKCRVLVCGLAFKGKPETADLRCSSGLEIALQLQERVAEVLGHDPVADAEAISAAGLQPVELADGCEGVDALLILNNHPTYQKLDIFSAMRSLASPALLYDGWHLFRPEEVVGICPCVYMGLGFTRSSVPATANREGERA